MGVQVHGGGGVRDVTLCLDRYLGTDSDPVAQENLSERQNGTNYMSAVWVQRSSELHAGQQRQFEHRVQRDVYQGLHLSLAIYGNLLSTEHKQVAHSVAKNVKPAFLLKL